MAGCWNMRSCMLPKQRRHIAPIGVRLMSGYSFEVAPSLFVSRRTLLRWAAMSSVTLPAASLLAQEAKSRGELAPLNRFSRMVQEWFVEQVRKAEGKIK